MKVHGRVWVWFGLGRGRERNDALTLCVVVGSIEGGDFRKLRCGIGGGGKVGGGGGRGLGSFLC